MIIIHSNTLPVFSHICIWLFLLKRSSMWMDGFVKVLSIHWFFRREISSIALCFDWSFLLLSSPFQKINACLNIKALWCIFSLAWKVPTWKVKKKKKSAPKALAACQQFPTLGANQCIFTFQLMYRQLPIPVEVLRIFPCSSCRLFRNRKHLAADPILGKKHLRSF